MATFLDLVNKVINESACELEELTSGTWSSAEAGRRIYPRIKRHVADAWKAIQMEKDTWEFRSAELSSLVYPRVKYNTGTRVAGTPTAGTEFQGVDSGFVLTVRSVIVDSGTWAAGTAVGQIEFDDYEANGTVVSGEVFEEVSGAGSFVYLEQGSYSFSSDILEINWPSFVANQGTNTSVPITYIPFENWVYQDLSFTTSSNSVPAYVSQDTDGYVVFYPQSLTPFRVKFIYTAIPQILSAYNDSPSRLPSSYHDWIAWEGLMRYALFDKSPDLYSYAKANAQTYRTSAELNLLPIVSWSRSRFNE